MFTIASININGYGDRYGAWERRRAILRDAISGSGAAIVALQAVRCSGDREDGLDQAAQLAKLLPGVWHQLYLAGTIYENGEREGSALLARVPFMEMHAWLLPNDSPREDPVTRLVLAGSFLLAAGRLNIFNCHFSWVGEEFGSNIERAAPMLRSLPGMSLLIGDFNAEPGAPALTELRHAGFVDVWRMLREPEAGFTFPADRPEKRIDYAWSDQKLTGYARTIDVLESGPAYSDHLGLRLELDL